MSRVVRADDSSVARFGNSVLALVRRWKLYQILLAWIVFFLVTTLLMFLSSWSSMASKAILGATSLQFLLILTAANSLVVMVVIVFSASRQYGWPSVELKLIRFTVEAGVSLVAFGLVTALIVLPSFRQFSLDAVMALVVFPAFIAIYNLCLHAMASSFVNRRKGDSSNSASRGGVFFGVVVPILIFASILVVMFIFFPKVTFATELMHDCALKRVEMRGCLVEGGAYPSSTKSN